MSKKYFFHGITIVAASVALAACGGGSSYNGTPSYPNFQPPPPPPPPPPALPAAPEDFRTQEFETQYGLASIGAEYAYAEGYTGKGVTIGFVDFNFDFDSDEVNYTAASRDIDPEMLKLYDIQIGPDNDPPTEPHGHAVAVVAAGIKNQRDTHGVAYDSPVIAVDYFSGVNKTIEQANGSRYHVSNPYSYLVENGARVVSISIGYDEEDIIENPPTRNPDGSPITDRYVVATPAYVIEGGGLLIAAAGNDSDPDPQLSLIDMYNDYIDEYNLLAGGGGFLVVGAVDQSNNLADFSDKAGVLKDHYVVAPGVRIVAPWETEDDGPGLYYVGGTSFAAPHVAGAAAIIMQKWPSLSANQVAQIIKDTATDLGDPGVDVIYGHGMLNLREAISAQGGVQTSSSTATPFKPNSDIDITGIRLGAAFGDASIEGLDRVMGLDKYGRDFYYNVADKIVNVADYGFDLKQQMQAARQYNAHQWQLGRSTNMTLGFTENDLSDTALSAQSNMVQHFTKPAKVKSLRLGGQVSQNLTWQVGVSSSLHYALNGHFDDTLKRPYMMTDQGQDTLLGGSGIWALSDYYLGDNQRISLAINVGQDHGLDRHFLATFRKDTTKQSAIAEWSLMAEDSTLALQLGNLFERDTLLGSRFSGGLKMADKTNTSFAGMRVWQGLTNDLSFSFDGKIGYSQIDGTAGSLFLNIPNFASTQWQANIALKNALADGDSMMLRVSQPLRVENSTALVEQGIGLDVETGNPLYQTNQVSLSPTGREMAFEAGWQNKASFFGHMWTLEANLAYRLDAGHTKDRTDTAGMIRARLRF